MSGDGDLLIANAIRWVAVGASPELDPIDHNFMDNGRYDVYLQIIDDDMWWDFSGPEPVFLGPDLDPETEDADPMDWIGGTVFTTEIDNTDPVISPRIRAYVEADLSIRVTGQPNEDCEMRLYKGDTMIGSVVCFHSGNEKIKVLSGVTIEMTEINDYRIEVEYFGTDEGANPTWIFSGHFPSGKIKELKHVFKEDSMPDNIWHIGADLLKKMIIGEDIIFEAEAEDKGSDDLAFVWNFGDSTPHGIHLYANVDQGTAVDAVSDEATVIFDQLGEFIRDPDFVKDDNTIRSPDGDPISIRDTISHVFDANQPYYYYVTLVVMDDDVKDDYPSTQLHPSPGCDIVFVEIDLS